MRALIVCTGNLCRSPVIEAALRTALPRLEVSSAGTRATAGRAVHPLTAAAAVAAGTDPGPHASRPLGPELLRGVDLVVTAERAHRAPVLALRPDLLRRTFTFLELVQLADAVRPRLAPGHEVDALRAVVLERGRHPVVDADLADPVDGGPAEHEHMVATVRAGVDRLLGALTAAAPGPA